MWSPTQQFTSNPYSPNYSVILDVEQQFNWPGPKRWMRDNWHTSFYWSALYVVLVFGGRSWMANRPAYKLRPWLVLWNILLATFSIIGTIRTWPEMLHVLREFGFTHSVCSASYVEQVKISGFWTWMFVLSKAPELIDTIFIVLRKQKLIFLHWYHHITVLIFTWYCYPDHTATARWYINMNYFVHAMMYSYYAIRACGIRVPKQVAIVITTSQIVQMIGGAFVTYYAYQRKVAGEFCQISFGAIYWGLLMYGSYFLLFSWFFINAYLRAPGSARKLVKKVE